MRAVKNSISSDPPYRNQLIWLSIYGDFELKICWQIYRLKFYFFILFFPSMFPRTLNIFISNKNRNMIVKFNFIEPRG